MTCPYCDSVDLIGPFEMDGFSTLRYCANGLWWIVCRSCHKTTNVPKPVTS